MPPAADSQLASRVRGLIAVALGMSKAELAGEVSQERYAARTSLRHLALRTRVKP